MLLCFFRRKVLQQFWKTTLIKNIWRPLCQSSWWNISKMSCEKTSLPWLIKNVCVRSTRWWKKMSCGRPGKFYLVLFMISLPSEELSHFGQQTQQLHNFTNLQPQSKPKSLLSKQSYLRYEWSELPNGESRVYGHTREMYWTVQNKF